MGGVLNQSSGFGKFAEAVLVGPGPAYGGSTIDPGGTVFGLYGKNPKTPIDPLTFTGIYGYKTKEDPATSRALFAQQNQDAAPPPGPLPSGTKKSGSKDDKTTSNLLFGS